jgi:hypothetical protein
MALDALPRSLRRNVEKLGIDKIGCRLGRDEEPDSGPAALQKDGPDIDAIKNFLRDHLPTEAYQRLCEMFCFEADPAEDDGENLERETSEREEREETPLATMTNDEPEPFRGQPRPGGTMRAMDGYARKFGHHFAKPAMDRMGADYETRFPGAVCNVMPGGTAR